MSHIGERQQSNRRVLELTTLYEISKILGSSLDLEQSLTGTLRILNSFMGMRKGTILLYDATTGELSIRLALGMTPEEMARGKYQMGEGILASLIGQTVNLQQHVMREREGLLEQQQIIRALARANGVQARAAALLGITPRQLGYRLRNHQIVRSFQAAGETVARGA